jgi:hypothetical protein
MPLSQVGTPLRGSGKDQSVWKLEWTYTDGSGAVSLDTAQSDQHPAVTTPVADGGTGITNVVFPKCRRAWVLDRGLEPPSADLADGTDFRHVEVTEVVAGSGTLNFRMVDIEGSGNLLDPNSGSRARLILLLERP